MLPFHNVVTPAVPNPAVSYQLGDVISRGRHSTVYLCLDSATGQMMAAKRYDVTAMAAKPRTLVQLKALAMRVDELCQRQITNPHVVQYIGVERTARAVTILMEYVPGGSIRKLVQRFGPLNEELVRMYTRQLLLGLAELHACGVVHGGVSCACIYLTQDGVVKTANWAGQLSSSRCGEKNLHDAADDCFAIGCAVVEMASGHVMSESTGVWRGTQQFQPEMPTLLSVLGREFLARCFSISDTAVTEELLRHPFIDEADRGGHYSGSEDGCAVAAGVLAHLPLLLQCNKKTEQNQCSGGALAGVASGGGKSNPLSRKESTRTMRRRQQQVAFSIMDVGSGIMTVQNDNSNEFNDFSLPNSDDVVQVETQGGWEEADMGQQQRKLMAAKNLKYVNDDTESSSSSSGDGFELERRFTEKRRQLAEERAKTKAEVGEKLCSLLRRDGTGNPFSLGKSIGFESGVLVSPSESLRLPWEKPSLEIEARLSQSKKHGINLKPLMLRTVVPVPALDLSSIIVPDKISPPPRKNTALAVLQQSPKRLAQARFFAALGTPKDGDKEKYDQMENPSLVSQKQSSATHLAPLEFAFLPPKAGSTQRRPHSAPRAPSLPLESLPLEGLELPHLAPHLVSTFVDKQGKMVAVDPKPGDVSEGQEGQGPLGQTNSSIHKINKHGISQRKGLRRLRLFASIKESQKQSESQKRAKRPSTVSGAGGRHRRGHRPRSSKKRRAFTKFSAMSKRRPDLRRFGPKSRQRLLEQQRYLYADPNLTLQEAFISSPKEGDTFRGSDTYRSIFGNHLSEALTTRSDVLGDEDGYAEDATWVFGLSDESLQSIHSSGEECESSDNGSTNGEDHKQESGVAVSASKLKALASEHIKHVAHFNDVAPTKAQARSKGKGGSDCKQLKRLAPAQRAFLLHLGIENEEKVPQLPRKKKDNHASDASEEVSLARSNLLLPPISTAVEEKVVGDLFADLQSQTRSASSKEECGRRDMTAGAANPLRQSICAGLASWKDVVATRPSPVSTCKTCSPSHSFLNAATDLLAAQSAQIENSGDLSKIIEKTQVRFRKEQGYGPQFDFAEPEPSSCLFANSGQTSKDFGNLTPPALLKRPCAGRYRSYLREDLAAVSELSGYDTPWIHLLQVQVPSFFSPMPPNWTASKSSLLSLPQLDVSQRTVVKQKRQAERRLQAAAAVPIPLKTEIFRIRRLLESSVHVMLRWYDIAKVILEQRMWIENEIIGEAENNCNYSEDRGSGLEISGHDYTKAAYVSEWNNYCAVPSNEENSLNKNRKPGTLGFSKTSMPSANEQRHPLIKRRRSFQNNKMELAAKDDENRASHLALEGNKETNWSPEINTVKAALITAAHATITAVTAVAGVAEELEETEYAEIEWGGGEITTHWEEPWWGRAISEWTAESESEMNVKVGERLFVWHIDDESGWWYVSRMDLPLESQEVNETPRSHDGKGVASAEKRVELGKDHFGYIPGIGVAFIYFDEEEEASIAAGIDPAWKWDIEADEWKYDHEHIYSDGLIGEAHWEAEAQTAAAADIVINGPLPEMEQYKDSSLVTTELASTNANLVCGTSLKLHAVQSLGMGFSLGSSMLSLTPRTVGAGQGQDQVESKAEQGNDEADANEVWVWALADYSPGAEEDSGLTLVDGCLLRVTEQTESGWWNGVIVDPDGEFGINPKTGRPRDGEWGWFPSTYVTGEAEKSKGWALSWDLAIKGAPAGTEGSGGVLNQAGDACAVEAGIVQMVRAVADYVSEPDEESGESTGLNLHEGDIIVVTEQSEDGWWHGYKHSQLGPNGEEMVEDVHTAARGWFPCTYVEFVNPGVGDSGVPRDTIEEVVPEATSKSPQMVRVLTDYLLESDEQSGESTGLSLLEGDIIIVTEQREDGWLYGYRHSRLGRGGEEVMEDVHTAASGWCPRTYVEFVE